MVASNPIMEHKKLAVTLGTYGNDAPSCMSISHGRTSGTAAISFERTLRVPDNQAVNSLPPSLGQFPLFSVADYQDRMPAEMATKGGIFLPMYQREAMWLKFAAKEPFALKIYVGGVNAISGVPIKESTEATLKRLKLSNTVKQDYVVLPEQPWLDGIASDDGRIRQFVAMPKGSGYSVEAQVTGEEKIDGMQFELTPVKRGCPKSLTVNIHRGGPSRYLSSNERVMNLQEKRLSDMSTVLDLKKAVETEFGIEIIDQDLRLYTPHNSGSQAYLNDDQLTFAEMWLPESTVLHVYDRKALAKSAPVSKLTMQSAFSASASSNDSDDGTTTMSNYAYSMSDAAPMLSAAQAAPLPSGAPLVNLAAPMATQEAGADKSRKREGAMSRGRGAYSVSRRRASPETVAAETAESAPLVKVQAMSLAAGGLIKQSINADPYPASIWDTESTIMFNVQLLNSESFMAVTGRAAPSSPIDAKTYQQYGYPFFDIWNEELSGVKGDFGVVKSVGEMDENKAMAEKVGFWEKLTGEGGKGKEDTDFKRDEPLKFPVVMLDMSHTRTFKPIKQMEEEAQQLKENN